MTEWDEEAFTQWLSNARSDLVPKLTASAFVLMPLVASDLTDVQFALQLGMAIMLDKPILVLRVAGIPMPPKLEHVVDRVVDIDDMASTESKEHAAVEIKEFLVKIGVMD